mgnify:FL=1
MPVMVGGVIEKNGKYLLVQEGKDNCKGKWNLPAGHLEVNESLFDGAKREIYEETGCKVKLTGLLQLSHRVFEDKIFVGFMFSTKLTDEHINVDNNEILNAKWFSYNELVNMKDDLRLYYWILDAIKSYEEDKIMDLHTIKMENDVMNIDLI